MDLDFIKDFEKKYLVYQNYDIYVLFILIQKLINRCIISHLLNSCILWKKFSSRAKSSKLMKKNQTSSNTGTCNCHHLCHSPNVEITFIYFVFNILLSGNFSWSWMFSRNWRPCKSRHKRQRSIGGHQSEGHWRRWRDAVTFVNCFNCGDLYSIITRFSEPNQQDKQLVN